MTPHPDGIFPVEENVLRITRAAVNCYLVRTADGPVLIDAGLPRAWPLLTEALRSIGSAPDDLQAVYLTHGHFDHVGMGARLSRDHRIPLHIHEKDVALAAHPYRYDHERSRLGYPFRYPAALGPLGRMVAAGALGVRGVRACGDVAPGTRLLGGLVPVATPGHTYGHCAFFLPETGVLFSGDALVTYDPYTGATGPRVVARAATADATAATAALANLGATDARSVLPGHGDPFPDGARRAVRAAVAAGVA